MGMRPYHPLRQPNDSTFDLRVHVGRWPLSVSQGWRQNLSRGLDFRE